jgi:hypothetical protein
VGVDVRVFFSARKGCSPALCRKGCLAAPFAEAGVVIDPAGFFCKVILFFRCSLPYTSNIPQNSCKIKSFSSNSHLRANSGKFEKLPAQ